MKIKEYFKAGLFTQNPLLIQLLGLCPALATTTTVANAIGMGISATAVLIVSNAVISLLRKFIPKKIRLITYLSIIACFVTVAEMLLQAYFMEIYTSLGVFVPLIVINSLILTRAETFASKNKFLPSVLDGFTMGLGFTLALVLLAFVREVLGSGTIMGYPLFGGSAPFMILALPAGGFLSLGFLGAFVQTVKNRKKGGAK